MTIPRADFPYTAVGIGVVFYCQITDISEERPQIFVDSSGIIGKSQSTIHHFAVDVPLVLLISFVAYSYRPRTFIPFQMIERCFRDVTLPFQRIHYLELTAAVSPVCFMQKMDESFRFFDVAE